MHLSTVDFTHFVAISASVPPLMCQPIWLSFFPFSLFDFVCCIIAHHLFAVMLCPDEFIRDRTHFVTTLYRFELN